jgi:hypothetical protein
MRWECRYSSSEMYYVEITDTEVRCYLHHSPDRATRVTFEQFLNGDMNYEVNSLFSSDEIAAMKAAVQARINAK